MLEPGHVAALLVDRGEQPGQRTRQGRELLAALDVAREEDDAAEPVLGPGAKPVRRGQTLEARQQTRRRQRLELAHGRSSELLAFRLVISDGRTGQARTA